jgi:signal transduction histidine kinase
VTLGMKRGILRREMASTTQFIHQKSPGTTWLTIARVLQVLIICLTVGLFIASIPANYDQRSILCSSQHCPSGQLTTESTRTLERMGLTVDTFVSLTIALDTLVVITYTACAIVIFLRKPDDLFTIFVTIMLVTFACATFTGAIRGFAFAYPRMAWLVATIGLIGNCSILAFLFIFPNGRFIPRWTVILLVVYFLMEAPRYYFPDSSFNLNTSNPSLYNLLFTALNLSGLGVQIYRYRRISDAIEKQQTKWVVYGVAIGVGGYMFIRLLSLLIPYPYGTGLPLTLVISIVAILLMLLLPVSISIAVMRYRLWDINPIINRTLVYGALSASTIALYVVAVGLFSYYFQHSQAGFVVPFVATGVIAILFQPLRERLQRSVNRLMYGESDDPATVLTRLSQRLSEAIEPAAVLPTIVETVAQTLRLPYAAIVLNTRTDETHVAADFGVPPPELVHFPLSYHTEPVGELLLAPRAAGESFLPADMKLLNIIVQQAGTAAHAIRLAEDLRELNADLQQSRERMVTAQEEERRRLRRDLHDGVGPTLASLSQRLDTAADLVASDPQASVELLKELKGQVKGTVAEIRRLVYALRPPVLDEFGLVSAVREHVAPYTGPNGLHIEFDVTEPMPPLPAAVEVAAYRIALEAFTNVVQHAQATRCTITIRVEKDMLLVEVIDDGTGIVPGGHAGVGSSSMRERAAELGGECWIEKNLNRGTRVRAHLPIAREPS